MGRILTRRAATPRRKFQWLESLHQTAQQVGVSGSSSIQTLVSSTVLNALDKPTVARIVGTLTVSQASVPGSGTYMAAILWPYPDSAGASYPALSSTTQDNPFIWMMGGGWSANGLEDRVFHIDTTTRRRIPRDHGLLVGFRPDGQAFRFNWSLRVGVYVD